MAEFEIEEGQEAGKKTEAVPGKQPEAEQIDTPNEIEVLATELGWRPKDEFSGEDFVDATMFIKRSRDIQDTMKGHIKDQKRQLADLNSSVEELKVHNERVYKVEVANLKKELTTLKAEKKAAIEDGDVAKVDELDERIGVVEESMVAPAETSTKKQETATPEFEEWVKNNSWYKTDEEMRQYADSLADENKGLSFERVAKLVTKRVKEAFPDKLSSKKEVIDRVEGSTRNRSAGSFTEADLTSSQKAIMSQFVRQGIMTKQQYIKDIQTMET